MFCFLTRNNKEKMNQIKQYLSSVFQMKDLGELDILLKYPEIETTK